MPDDDPLDGADVGETRTVRRELYLHGVDMEPVEFYGMDRSADIRIADLEVCENSEGEPRDVRITWEADVTKHLPPRWDQATEPRTVEEMRVARRTRWLKTAARALAVLLPVGIALGVAYWMMQGLDGSVTINGEPLRPPPVLETLPVVLLVVVIVWLISWGVRGGFPGKVKL